MVKRRQHSAEFKIEAVRLLLQRGDRTVTEIADNLGVNANQLHRWRRRYEKAVLNPSQHARETAEQSEIRRLKKELDRVKMEREILKNDRGAGHQPVKTETPPDVVFCMSTEGSGRPLFGGSTP